MPSPLGLNPYAGGIGLGGESRNDGGVKGSGYFGPIPAPNGMVATEYSMDFGNGDIPSVVPTLTERELQMVLRNELTPDIVGKITSWAEYRNSQGKSPFRGAGELRLPVGGAPGADIGVLSRLVGGR